MWTPTMNCEWDYPEWQYKAWPEWISIKEKPEICEECEFFMICFMNRSSEILGMPMNLSVESMTQHVNLQRLQEQWFDDDVVWAYVNHISLSDS